MDIGEFTVEILPASGTRHRAVITAPSTTDMPSFELTFTTMHDPRGGNLTHAIAKLLDAYHAFERA